MSISVSAVSHALSHYAHAHIRVVNFEPFLTMKVKRYKHAKKVLSFYKNTFKIREPYQVIGEELTRCPLT